MPRTKEELARIHLETAIALTNTDTILAWMTKPHSTPPSSPIASGGGKPRGRKPGAAAEESRCTWMLTSGGQCKNAKVEGSSHCKIHAIKSTAIAAAATATSVVTVTASESSPSV